MLIAKGKLKPSQLSNQAVKQKVGIAVCCPSHIQSHVFKIFFHVSMRVNSLYHKLQICNQSVTGLHGLCHMAVNNVVNCDIYHLGDKCKASK